MPRHLFGFIGFLTLLILVLDSLTFFRHDDWLILGNSVTHLPQNWSFAWSNQLFFSPHKAETWFFRPFFKFIVWGAYQIWGLHHLFWTLFQWFLFLCSAGIGAKAIAQRRTTQTGMLFFVSIISSFSLSVGSLIWVGEGMMNVPQVFLLIASVFLFLQKSRTTQCFSVFPYVLSLGFKESSVFLPSILLSLAVFSNELRKKSLLLIAFFLVSCAFLFFRLVVLDFNPAYLPIWNLKAVAVPLAYILGLILISFVALCLSGVSKSLFSDKQFWRNFLFCFPFLGLLILPYLGHSFFSPGWLLLPGFFSLWCFFYCVPLPVLENVSLVKVFFLTLILSSLPVFYQMHRIRWFDWGRSQKQIYSLFESLPETTSEIWIENCADPSRPDLSLQRVVGAEDNLVHLWRLLHSNYIPIRLFACKALASSRMEPGITQLRWNFYNFESLTRQD